MVACCVAEFESALGENAQGKWHVCSDAITQKAHEGISQAAFEKLDGPFKARLNVEKLKQGAIWNDMPSGVETEEAAMIKDGHMDVDVRYVPAAPPRPAPPPPPRAVLCCAVLCCAVRRCLPRPICAPSHVPPWHAVCCRPGVACSL
jgi:hypothetical protein